MRRSVNHTALLTGILLASGLCLSPVWQLAAGEKDVDANGDAKAAAVKEPAKENAAKPAGDDAAKKEEVKKSGAKDGKKDNDKKAADKYLRIVRDAKGDPTSMETSIVTFRKKGSDDLEVDLVGAVHVGEGKYYDALNKAFDDYDVVLYELVAPEGTKIPKGGRGGSGHPVGAIQQGLKNILELEFQLERIDYTKDNFVHADMSPEEFAKTMKARGESFLQMFFRMMGAAVAQQSGKKGGASDAEVLFALFSPDRSFRLKRIMASQFEDLGGVMTALEGPKGSTIIGERNRKALEVLKEQIDSGKKKIAIFYGAGHMPDMEKRLAADFQLTPGEVKWIEAWNLREPKGLVKPAPKKKRDKDEKKAESKPATAN